MLSYKPIHNISLCIYQAIPIGETTTEEVLMVTENTRYVYASIWFRLVHDDRGEQTGCYHMRAQTATVFHFHTPKNPPRMQEEMI